MPQERYQRNRLNLSWLIKLRWSMIAGQTCTILGVAWLLEIRLPVSSLFLIVAIEAVSNLLATFWVGRTERIAEYHVAAVMALDVALLTGLLYLTGGPTNPFSFLYLVHDTPYFALDVMRSLAERLRAMNELI